MLFENWFCKKNKSLFSDFDGIKVIFKMDDLEGHSNEVLKLDKIVQSENLKVSWGVVGFSLEKGDSKYFGWVRSKNITGQYEFWNHGYSHSSGPYEFLDQSVVQQKESLQKTQKLGKKKLGIIFRTLGAPANKIDENTAKALDKISEIKNWFYGLPSSKNNLIRTVNMEFSVGNLDASKLKEAWESDLKPEDKLVVLQGHPNMWNDQNFAEFVKIIKFLKEKEVMFVLPADIFGCK